MGPVPETDSRGARDTTQVDDQTQEDQEYNEQNLEQGEPEFDLAVDTYKGHADDDGQTDEDDDPHGRVDRGRPVLKQDAYRRDLGRDGQAIAVDQVVPVGFHYCEIQHSVRTISRVRGRCDVRDV